MLSCTIDLPPTLHTARSSRLPFSPGSQYNKGMDSSLVIIGAGPAGMTAALFATRAGQPVTLVDANPQVGRKLLVTGSGRANLTNAAVSAERYACADREWMAHLFTSFGHQDLLDFLHSIGVLTFATPDGWVYPLSESAQTVVDAFDAALHLAGVTLKLDSRVKNITRSGGGFDLRFESAPALHCERLVVAAGGKAYPTLGSRGDLFASLRSLGHSVIPLTPALAPVTCEMKPYQKLQGVRLDARVRLYADNKPLDETTGNLIFTQWGLNGPAVMDLSHWIPRDPSKKWEVRLDLLFKCEKEIKQRIAAARASDLPLRVALGAALPPKVPPVVMAMAGIPADAVLNRVSDAQLERLFRLLTALPFTVTGVRGFEFCQVSAGGVPVSEVDPLTMRSLIVPNLWLAGETLDAVGPCGGYNLQFAFSTGAVAGMDAGKKGRGS